MQKFYELLLSSLCLLCTISPGAATEEIHWVLADEPPTTFVEDGAHVGYGTDMLRLLQKKMPGYDHNMYLGGNYQRVLHLIEEGPLNCTIGVIKTEDRLAAMSFSALPAFFFFNMQIVTRRSVFNGLGHPDSISLDAMLKKDDLTLTLPEGRKYTPNVQNILDQHKGAANIRMRPSAQLSATMLRMMQHNRFDYMFAYPEEVSYLTRKLDGLTDIVTIPMTESQTLGHAWIVCSKTPEGNRAMAAINQALKSVRQTKEYRTAYEPWIGENLLPLYREKYQSEFLKISE